MFLRIVPGILLALILLLVLLETDVRLPALTFSFVIQAATAYLFSVAAHEVGHLAAGKLSGMRPLVFAAWPLRLDRRGGSWRATWLGRTRLAGFVLMDPGRESGLAKRMFLMIGAGPLASALASGAGIALAGIAAGWPGWLAGELKVISFWSMLIAVLGLLPIPHRYAVNDGMRLGMLLRHREQAQRFCCLALLAPAMLGGIRPRDWRRDLVERLPGPLDGSLDAISAQTIRYNFLLDSGGIEEADRVLQWLVVQRVPGEAGAIWRLEAVWMQARFRADLPGARQWMDLAGTRVKTPDGQCALWKARAAIALLEQHWTEAQEGIGQALQASERMSDIGITQAIREELTSLAKDLDLKKLRQGPGAT